MNILIGYDGSKSAKSAIEFVKLHARSLNATVYITTSFTQSQEVNLQEMGKMEDAVKELDDIKAQFITAGIACGSLLLVSGLSAGENLVRYAQEKEAELIVIGVRKHSKIGKLLFGSTAQFVILEADCPVVAVK